MVNKSAKERRRMLDFQRKGLTLRRQGLQENRKVVSKQREKIEVQQHSAECDQLKSLQERVIELQDQVRQLQLLSDAQRLEVRTIKSGVDKILPDIAQDLEEQRMKIREDWQTFYEAGQTLTENRQEQLEQLMEMREKRNSKRKRTSMG